MCVWLHKLEIFFLFGIENVHCTTACIVCLGMMNLPQLSTAPLWCNWHSIVCVYALERMYGNILNVTNNSQLELILKKYARKSLLFHVHGLHPHSIASRAAYTLSTYKYIMLLCLRVLLKHNICYNGWHFHLCGYWLQTKFNKSSFANIP